MKLDFYKEGINKIRGLKNTSSKKTTLFSILVLVVIVILVVSVFSGKYYIQRADFQFATNPVKYFYDHFFLWSFNKGALNSDGIIRLIARAPNMLVFFITQSNLIVSYFFIATYLLTAFISFFLFQKQVLKIQDKSILILFSVIFTLNPVFLGNFSKLGLNFGVAVLPLAIYFLSKGFELKNVWYFVPVILFLNFSLVHPFNLLINFTCTFLYFVLKSYKNWGFISQNIPGLVIIFFIGILSNLYFILPILSLGSFDKASFSRSIGEDTTANNLISLAKTSGIFEAFALSKSIFVDYRYYEGVYQAVYYGSIYIFYLLLIFLFAYSFRFVPKNKLKFLSILGGIFIVLILLSTGSTYSPTEFISSILYNIPLVGWAFRSPLKWQLYMPIVLFGMSSIVSFYALRSGVISKSRLLASVSVLFIFANGYLLKDITNFLLLPKEVSQLKDLQSIDFKDKRVLLVKNTDACRRVLKSNPDLSEEINSVLRNGGNLFQQSGSEGLIGNKIIYNSFDYVLTCSRDQSLADEFDFTYFTSQQLVLLKNKNPNPLVFPSSNIYRIDDYEDSNNEYDFLKNQGIEQIFFTTDDVDLNRTTQLPSVDELFNKPSALSKSIENQRIPYIAEEDLELFFNLQKQDIWYSLNDQGFLEFKHGPEVLLAEGEVIEINREPINFSLQLDNFPAEDYFIEYDGIFKQLHKGEDFLLSITDKPQGIRIFKASSQNLIPNPSFEEGLWREKAGDCFNYDDNPIINMELITSEATDGNNSLQLESTRHIACTSIIFDIPEDPGDEFIFGFDHKSPNAERFEYDLSIGEYKVDARPPNGTPGEWSRYSRYIQTSGQGNVGIIKFSSVPVDEKINVVSLYDNVRLSPLEEYSTVNTSSFLSSQSQSRFQKLKDIDKGTLLELDASVFGIQNLIPNPSFEEGLWREKAGDCFNYDDNPIINMELITSEATDGNNSLQLESTRHIACTSTELNIKNTTRLLLSFDYNAVGDNRAGFTVSFNDLDNTTIQKRLENKEGEWDKFSTTIDVPPGATAISLTVSSFPTNERDNIVTRYDNFKLISVPDLRNRFFLLSKTNTDTLLPQVNFQKINPTRYKVEVRNAKDEFFLNLQESFDPNWKMYFNGQGAIPFLPLLSGTISDNRHISYNGLINAWLINPVEICGDSNRCNIQEDGSIDMDIIIEYTPQRWFYLGLLISILTVGVILYLLLSYTLRNKSNRVEL
jgi:hypothetical protein